LQGQVPRYPLEFEQDGEDTDVGAVPSQGS
jgi:hypothetical protein